MTGSSARNRCPDQVSASPLRLYMSFPADRCTWARFIGYASLQQQADNKSMSSESACSVVHPRLHASGLTCFPAKTKQPSAGRQIHIFLGQHVSPRPVHAPCGCGAVVDAFSSLAQSGFSQHAQKCAQQPLRDLRSTVFSLQHSAR